MKNKRVDGLRGIAALNVLLAHFIAAFLPMMLFKNYPTLFAENSNPSQLFEILTSPIISIFYNGHFAVLIFFVLSGYVLTLPFFDGNKEYRAILQKRLWGRYFRLNIPIGFAILSSYIIYRLGLYSNIQAAKISGSINWLDSFFHDIITPDIFFKELVFDSILYGKNNLIPPLWTLKIEFIGSIYILLFYISKPKNFVFIPLLIASTLIYALHLQDSIYYFAIFAGSFLSSFKKLSRYRIIIFIIGIYFGGFQSHSVAYEFLPNLSIINTEIWDKKTLYNSAGAVLTTLSVLLGFGSKLFESMIFQYLGRISFSIYLLHFIVLCSISSYLHIHFPMNMLTLILNFTLYMSICFFISTVFERIIDRWAIHISSKISITIQKNVLLLTRSGLSK